jgi:6-phosphogluconolactonase
MANITYIDGASDADIALWLANALQAALDATTGPIAITLPGGSTPFPILAEVARLPQPIDWSRIVVWPGDDRIVEEASPASNVGRIRAALEPLGARIVPLSEGATPPSFALAWLGMGNDGHIASLFPNTNPTANAPNTVLRLTPDPLPPEAPYDRLSLTIPALAQAGVLLFVVRGDQKRALFVAAEQAEHDLPVARLLAARLAGETVCFS